MLHAINSSDYCGEPKFNGKFKSWVARISYNMYWVEQQLGYGDATCKIHTVGGEFYRKCW